MKGVFKDNWKKYFDLGLIPYPAHPTIKGTYIRWEKDFPPQNVTEKICEEWARKFPDHNIWVVIGSHVVIDPDGLGAEDFVRSLNLPPCPTSISGNKSTHRWFKISSPIKPVKAMNGEDKTFLELRTGNMGMLAPPSIHPETKREYKWGPGQSPWELSFPEIPPQAYEKILALTEKTEPKMEEADPSLEGKLDVRKYLSHYGIKVKIKPDGQRVIYTLEKCLFADSHTTPDSRGDSSIIQGPDGKLGYHCFHNHCAFKTWKDARRVISGDAKLMNFFVGAKGAANKEASEERFYALMKSSAMSLDEIIMTDFPERRKLLFPWIQEQSIILISGFRGVGKSIFALSICDAISREENFGPWEVKTSLPILYIDGEMVLSDIKQRALSIVKDQTLRKNPIIYFSDYAANLKGLPKTNLNSLKCQGAIRRMCRDWGIKLLVLDNISSLCPGLDENVKAAWDPINQWLLDLRFNDISAILLHHVNKGGGQRGTSGREDNVDISLTLERPKDYSTEDGARFIAKFTKTRIPQGELPLVSDWEFQLRAMEGKIEWAWTSSKKRRQDQIVEMLESGMTQAEIAAELGVSKPYVSKIAKTWKNGETT